MNSSAIRLWCVLLLVPMCHVVAAQEAPAGSGQQLPAPFGLGLTLYNQDQAYALDKLYLGLPGIDTAGVEDLPVDNRTDSYTLKLDWWAMPFLNLYAIGGRIDTITTVKIGELDFGLPFRIGDLRIENDGWIYGGGFTLVAGWDSWFTSMSATYTKADLEVTDGTLKAWVVSPKIGYAVDAGALWVGAMYQDAEEHHTGLYEIPYIGEVPFDVMMGEDSRWGGVVGGTVGLSEHLMLILEGGFGARTSAMVSLEYRR